MTIKSTHEKNTITQVFKGVMTKHPNEDRYPGRACYESQEALLQCMEALPDDDYIALVGGTLIHDEDETAALFDEMQVGDVIGVAFNERGQGMVPRLYKVLETKFEGRDIHLVEHLYHETLMEKRANAPKRQHKLTFEQVSGGIVLGYAEILYRDEKPYGYTEQELNKEYTVVFKVEDKEEEPAEVVESGE